MSGFGGGSLGGGGDGGGGFGGNGERIQGGGDRDSHKVVHSGLARAKFAVAVDRDVSGRTRPGLIERFKRWFSARF